MNISASLSKTIRVKTSLLVVLTTVMASSPSRSPAAAPPDPVRPWNQLALQRVRDTSASDAQAARLYAMVNIAMYDAVNGIIAREANKGRTHALVPPSAKAKGDQYAAAAAAAHAVLSSEVLPVKNTTKQQEAYDAQLASDLAAAGKGGKTKEGQEWGAFVGAEVRKARANDGSTPNASQEPHPDPIGHFRGSWSGVQFRKLAPFGITNSAVYVPQDGPPPLDSLDYAAAFAVVKLVGNVDNTDQGKLETFQFWSLAGGTSQPPGAWIQIALAVTGSRPLALAEMTRLFALVSMAMVDTVAPTVQTKFNFQHWRPFHAIREEDDGNSLTDTDPEWVQRATNIGTSPEYWSGHSSFSAAAATVLAGFYCDDNIEFALQTDSAPAGQTRSYPSFSVAADEAGYSRVVGGIHFPFSNEDGLEAGRAVAREILAKKLLLRNGPTHFGECPL